jgi:hypothetical protein
MIWAPLFQCKHASQSSTQVHAEIQRDLPEGWQSQPQQEYELEGVVEGEPVDDADKALEKTSFNY